MSSEELPPDQIKEPKPFRLLIVGVIVAALAGYEIRRNLIQMGGAYAASAESRDYLQSLLDSLLQDHRIRRKIFEDIHHERVLFRE